MSEAFKWSEKDKQSVIEFLNLVADKAELKLSVKDTIRFYNGLAYMQTTLLKKIEESMVEIIAVKEIKKK